MQERPLFSSPRVPREQDPALLERLTNSGKPTSYHTKFRSQKRERKKQAKDLVFSFCYLPHRAQDTPTGWSRSKMLACSPISQRILMPRNVPRKREITVYVMEGGQVTAGEDVG